VNKLVCRAVLYFDSLLWYLFEHRTPVTETVTERERSGFWARLITLKPTAAPSQMPGKSKKGHSVITQ